MAGRPIPFAFSNLYMTLSVQQYRTADDRWSSLYPWVFHSPLAYPGANAAAPWCEGSFEEPPCMVSSQCLHYCPYT